MQVPVIEDRRWSSTVLACDRECGGEPQRSCRPVLERSRPERDEQPSHLPPDRSRCGIGTSGQGTEFARGRLSVAVPRSRRERWVSPPGEAHAAPRIAHGPPASRDPVASRRVLAKRPGRRRGHGPTSECRAHGRARVGAVSGWLPRSPELHRGSGVSASPVVVIGVVVNPTRRARTRSGWRRDPPARSSRARSARARPRGGGGHRTPAIAA